MYFPNKEASYRYLNPAGFLPSPSPLFLIFALAFIFQRPERLNLRGNPTEHLLRGLRTKLTQTGINNERVITGDKNDKHETYMVASQYLQLF